MRFKTALITLILLICPFAFCYGQLSFFNVSGERGYTALRGNYKLNLDNGWILTPILGYYRMSDSDEDEKGAISRYGLRGAYELTDSFAIEGSFFWQPHVSGYSAVGYRVGAEYLLAYHWYIFQEVYLLGNIGHSEYSVYSDAAGKPLDSKFKEDELNSSVYLSTHVDNLYIQTSWHKVIQYSNKIGKDISFNWTDVPFMIAVVQGFVKQTEAVRLSYKTSTISPYAAFARYQYAAQHGFASAISAGINIKQGSASISGGIEIFEPRREENRKTFFTVSIEVEI